MLIHNFTLMFQAFSYADASGSGKDIYEYVSYTVSGISCYFQSQLQMRS